MKKHILFGAALLSLFAASCSNDEDIIDNGAEVVTGKTITLNATINNGADTRLTYTDDGNSMQVAWSDSESFTLYKGTSSTGTVLSNSADNKSVFTGPAIEGGIDSDPYYAVYGSDITNTNGTLNIDLSTQVGTSEENGIKEFMLATAEALTSSTTLTFNHKLTVLKLQLTLPESETGTTASMITINGMHNKGSYNLKEGSFSFRCLDYSDLPEYIHPEELEFYPPEYLEEFYRDIPTGPIAATNGSSGFAIADNKITAYVAVFPENVSANQVTIKATVGDNEYSYTIAGARTLQEGEVTPVNVTLTKVLSKEEVKNAIVDGNLTIEKELSLLDFEVLRQVLSTNEYSDINLTLSNQTSLPVSGSTGALEKCSALKSVSAPKVTSVGKNAFYFCRNLTSVELPEATSVGEYAFDYCSSLTSVSLPKATSVGGSAFRTCTSLTSVELPKVTSVGGFAFAECTSLTSVELPEATSMERYAFDGCSKLSSVSLPKVTSVGWYAFEACTSLTSVELPEATSVERNAFDGCTKSNIDLTVKDGTTWWGSESDWKSVTIIKVNFKSEYTAADYKTWSEENCRSAVSYDDMCKYLGAGVYWDNGDEGENQQTYQDPEGATHHEGLWVMKKAYIGPDVTGSKNETPKSGRPAKSEIGKYFFLPAAGYYFDGGFNYAGDYGCYWSSSPDGDRSAFGMSFGNNFARVVNGSRDGVYLPMVSE